MRSVQELIWELLACPRDTLPLRREGDVLVCPNEHRYAVVDGMPILLISDAEQTHIEGVRALAIAKSGDASSLRKVTLSPNEIDPFVQNAIGATNGSLYQPLVGKLKEYPIPKLRLPTGQGKLFLEIGCSWGRWCFAAARQGFRPVGVDPSLKSVRAAERVARQLGIDAAFVVGDARFLPFRSATFDQVFSYSVLQHLSKENVLLSLSEIARVLQASGNSLTQMANMYGTRCLYHQTRRGFREARDFEVRYWAPGEMLSAFREHIGPSDLIVDGFFSLNIQPADVRMLPPRYRAIVWVSEALRKISERIPALGKIADSLYVQTQKADAV